MIMNTLNTIPLLTGNTYYLIIIFICCLVFYYNFKRINLYKCAYKLPGPFAWPIIGNAHLFLKLTPSDYQPLFQKLIYTYGKVLRMWMGPDLYIAISEPKYLEKVLFSNNLLQKGDNYKFAKSYLGPGLATEGVSNVSRANKIFGPIWKHQRKSIFQFFNQKNMEDYVDSINIHSLDLVKSLEKYANGKTFNVFHDICDYTNRIICETLLGVPADEELVKHSGFTRHIEKVYAIAFIRMCKVWYRFDYLFKRSKYYLDHLETTYYLNIFFKFAQARKRAMPLQKPSPLDSIIDENTSLKEFGWNALTLQTASHESQATLVSLTLMLLGIYKDIQNKVHDELDAVFGDSDRFVVKDDLSNLVYLDLVFKEILRLYPSISNLTRTVLEDLKLSDDLTLPAGSTVMFPVYAIQRHSDFWRDPEEFIPERFLPEESKNRPPMAYLPFSHGPMNCVGQKFALWSNKIMLAILLRSFQVDCEYKSIHDIKLMTDISIRPVNGYKVKLIPRRKIT